MAKWCPLKATAALMLSHELNRTCDLTAAELVTNEETLTAIGNVRQCDRERCALWVEQVQECALLTAATRIKAAI